MHFDFTIGWGAIIGMSALCAVITFLWKFFNLAKRMADRLGVVFWEHKVMWEDWRHKNKVPVYPRLRIDE